MVMLKHDDQVVIVCATEVHARAWLAQLQPREVDVALRWGGWEITPVKAITAA